MQQLLIDTTRKEMKPAKYFYHQSASRGNDSRPIPNIFGNNTSSVDKHQDYGSSSTEFGQFHNTTRIGHSSDHVHPGTLAAFWSAIIIYFCVILLIAWNGKSGSKSVIDYCLVKKKVMKHEKAHVFDDCDDSCHNCCSCINLHGKSTNSEQESSSVTTAPAALHNSTPLLSFMSSLPKLRTETQKRNNSTGPIENAVTMPITTTRIDCLSISTGATIETYEEHDTENIDTNRSLTEEAPECAICLSQYQIGEIVAWSKLKDGCTHVFHYDCILEWALNGHSHCPVCRTAFWSRNRKKVDKIPREATAGSCCKTILFCAPACSLLRGNTPTDHTSSDGPEAPDGISSRDVIVEVHSEEAPPNPSMLESSLATKENQRGKDEQCIKRKVHISPPHQTKIERSHFCVLHGLISPQDNR